MNDMQILMINFCYIFYGRFKIEVEIIYQIKYYNKTYMNSRKTTQSSGKNTFQFSNKENQKSQSNSGVTRAKNYSLALSQQKQQRHGTTFLSNKKVLDDKINKTTIVTGTSKNNRLSNKLGDLQILQTKESSNIELKNKSNAKNIILNNDISQQIQLKQQNHHGEMQVSKNDLQLEKKQQSDQLSHHKVIKKPEQPASNQQKTLQFNSSPKSKKVLQPIKPSTLKQITQEKPKNSGQAMLKDYQIMDDSTHKFQKVYPERIMQTSNQMVRSNFEIFQQFSHVMKQIKTNYTINHVFNRHQSCMLSRPVHFQLPKTKDEVIFSQKVSRLFCSQFKIYLQKNGANHQLGTLKSNFTGSVYNFYPLNTDVIHFSILFDKVDDVQNKIRYSQIYINRNIGTNQQNLVDQIFIPYNKMESLEGVYKINQFYRQTKKIKNKIVKYTSKLPGWSEKYQSYNLDFGKHHHTVMPSVKNSIFIDQNEKQVMKFYKSSYLTYDITFEHPFSWIIAYGYALASTDFKLASQ